MCYLRCAACFSGLTCVAYPPQRIHCWNPVSGTRLLETSIWRDLGALKAHQKPVNRLLNYFLPCVMKDLRVAYVNNNNVDAWLAWHTATQSSQQLAVDKNMWTLCT